MRSTARPRQPHSERPSGHPTPPSCASLLHVLAGSERRPGAPSPAWRCPGACRPSVVTQVRCRRVLQPPRCTGAPANCMHCGRSPRSRSFGAQPAHESVKQGCGTWLQCGDAPCTTCCRPEPASAAASPLLPKLRHADTRSPFVPPCRASLFTHRFPSTTATLLPREPGCRPVARPSRPAGEHSNPAVFRFPARRAFWVGRPPGHMVRSARPTMRIPRAPSTDKKR